MTTFIHRCVVVAIFLGLNLAARVVVANQPVVRFRNKTVGIVAEGDADVVVASEKVKLTGDLEVKTTNNGTINVTEKIDLLHLLQDDIGQRVQHLAQHGGMGVVCNPKYTEYRARDLETGTFGECVCVKQGTREANAGLYYLFQTTRREIFPIPPRTASRFQRDRML